MMKKRIFILLLTVLLIVLSCSREPVPPPEPVIDYITIEQLRDMYEAGLSQVDTNVYIQGIITLTPELGNLPSFVAYIQDSTAGICLTVTGTNTFSRDSEVKILCRGASFTDYNGLLQFGDISIADQSEVISLTPAPLEPEVVTIASLLGGGHQAEYIRIEDVQFEDPGSWSGENIITDCTDELEVYTRSDATFSSETLPTGNGYITGVASNYSGVQLLVRDETENGMTGDRCGSAGTVYLSEDFSMLGSGADVSTLEGWETYNEAGTETWEGYLYNNNYFARVTAFGSGEASVIVWMIAPPVDLATATSPYVSFTSADGYDNGATLELFASSDYTGSSTPWTSTWTKLNFTLPPSTDPYYSDFISSGNVDLSAFTGSTVYLAWVYTGADLSGTDNDNTTTWEVDNVIVAE